MFFDDEDMKMRTDEVSGEDLLVGDGVILLCTDINYIHHFEEYTGPLPFVRRIMKFTNGRSCSITDNGKYKILKRI